MAKASYDAKLAKACVDALLKVYRRAHYTARPPARTQTTTAALRRLLHPDAPKDAIECYTRANIPGLIRLGAAKLVRGFKPPHDGEPWGRRGSSFDRLPSAPRS